MNHHKNLLNETRLKPKNNGVLKKSHKYLKGGKSSRKKSLKGPPNIADKISSGFSNVLGSISNLLTGGPPDVKFHCQTPFVLSEGDKNLKTNMTSENREIFMDDIGSSPEGRSFRDYLEKCQVIDDEEEQKGEEKEWTYTITPGQLKNYADKFCFSRDYLFGDEEKQNMFKLPDEKITFEASTKCEISDDEDDYEEDYYDDDDEESDDDEDSDD